MANLLAIETSGAVGSAAACRDGDILAEISFERGMEHGRALVPTLKELCKRVGWMWEIAGRGSGLPEDARLDVVAVSCGPGSYTGLRVGVTCAKAISFVTGCAVVAVPTLDVLAENAPPSATQVCPIIDAQRGQVYAAIYERQPEEGELIRKGDFLVITPGSLIGLLSARAVVLGPGLSRYRSVFEREDIEIAPEASWRASAGVVARRGMSEYRAGRTVDPIQLQPLYLRRPEAEEKFLAKEGAPSV